MNNKDLNKYMEKLGGSLSNPNSIKIANLDSMLDSESTDESAYTTSVLDLFNSSDSDSDSDSVSSYESEGGFWGKSKGKKVKKVKTRKVKTRKVKTKKVKTRKRNLVLILTVY